MCKVVNRAEIAGNDYETAGRYVGVEDQIDHDFDYESEMGIIKNELQELNAEAIHWQIKYKQFKGIKLRLEIFKLSEVSKVVDSLHQTPKYSEAGY